MSRARSTCGARAQLCASVCTFVCAVYYVSTLGMCEPCISVYVHDVHDMQHPANSQNMVTQPLDTLAPNLFIPSSSSFCKQASMNATSLPTSITARGRFRHLHFVSQYVFETSRALQGLLSCAIIYFIIRVVCVCHASIIRNDAQSTVSSKRHS